MGVRVGNNSNSGGEWHLHLLALYSQTQTSGFVGEILTGFPHPILYV